MEESSSVSQILFLPEQSLGVIFFPLTCMKYAIFQPCFVEYDRTRSKFFSKSLTFSGVCLSVIH